ncbi:MAG: hypothetical protein JO340_14870 [Acidobacteriaceae bacterium]|nr:hypothetical protein [Acidobacteriaceae bacterium]
MEQVLRAADVRLESFPESELTKKITSYAENKTGKSYFLAFYDDHGDGLLHLPLRLLRYHPGSGSITQAAIQRLLAPFGDTPRELPDLCAGSVLDIHEAAGHVFVSTHINPSAGCELIFSEQFELQASFTGWLLANLGSEQVLLHENEIHFASQHPMRLKAADLVHRKVMQLYPPAVDPLRSEYASQLRSHMPPERWCRDSNSMCDPSDFDCELDGRVAVSPDSNSFALIAVFDPGGFGTGAEDAVGRRRAAYVYSWDKSGWRVSRESRVDTNLKSEQLLRSQQ